MRLPLLVLLVAMWICLPAAEAADGPPRLLIGYTQGRNDLPGGQFENWRTARAHVVRADGTGARVLADSLTARSDSWTQFAGWSPDGRQAIVQSVWESRENAAWEREHKTFRHTEGWLLDACLVDMATGTATNLTAVDRVSDSNSGLFFLPDGSGYGFTAIIAGVSRPYVMGRDGRDKRPAAKEGTGFAYGYSASPDGKLISYHEDYQIYVSAVDGTGRRKIETGHPFNFAPVWSPDGQWLLFVSGEHEDCHPHVVRRDGTDLRKLADRGGYRGVVERLTNPDFHSESSDVPAWGRESRSIYYTAEVGDSVELMRAALDGAVEQLTHSRPGVRHYHPAVSPDGGWILFGSDSTGTMQLHVARADGRDAVVVTDAPPGSAAMHGHWQPAAAPLAARIDAQSATAAIGNDAVELAIEWKQGVRLAHFRDLAGGVEWIPQPPPEAPGPGPGGMHEGLVWHAEDIWPDLAPPSSEFLLRYSPTGDLDAAATAAAETLTGTAACRLVAKQSRAAVADSVARLDLVFAIDDHPLALGLHLEVRDGIPAVRRWTSLRNTGAAPCLLHRLTSAALTVRPGVDDLDLHWIETCTHPASGPRSPSRWRQATRHLERLGPATRRTLRSDASAPRPQGGSNGCLSWLALRDPGRDCGLYAGWEWSGLFDAEVGDFDKESGAGAFGMRFGFSDDGGYARVLAPGETFTTPKVFFGFFDGDAEEAGRATRQVAERLFGLPWPEGKPPMFVGYCTWSNWPDFGGSRLHLKPERLDEEIRRCQEIGVELFILDYDWFPLLGDFRSDPERFPDGVEAVARKVKAAGMKFGLWMGFGQAHADTPVAREHPEFLVVRDGRPFVGGWGMRSLCFAYEPARGMRLAEVSRIVEAFDVDWLKQDFDVIPVSDSRTHCPHATDTRIESVAGYYWIKDRLHERFPRLYLDNWTPPMGGPDFGNFQRHHSTMVCDDYHPTAVRTAAHGLAHLLPPQRTHAYLRAFSRAEERSPYAWRSAGFGNGMYVVSDILQWDDTTMAAAQRQIAEFKEMRPLFLDGDVHDLFPDKQPDRFGWDGRLVWSPSRRQGVAQVFRNHDPRDSVRIRLHGLPADGRYVVEQDAPVATARAAGQALLTEGIEVAIPAPFTSALLRIRADGPGGSGAPRSDRTARPRRP